ncbi:hypothetical protein ScPMuIL_003037 [Solemya velum]
MVKAYKGQRYSQLKSANLKKGSLFEDPEFPANSKSLFYNKVDHEVEWKRPKELCKVPRLIVEGMSCEDLVQGELGNCWFVVACASLANERKLWDKVVPDIKEQEWDEKSDKPKYAGIFHFNCWRFGEWVDVVIDDKLPTKDGKLICVHSKTQNEFWSALLEKAYAKLYGDYESLFTANTADALVDFTGGVAEKILTENFRQLELDDHMKIFMHMRDALKNHALINCYIQCEPDQIGEETSDGIAVGYGYNITKVLPLQVEKKFQGALGATNLFMIRMVNPWRSKNWSGPWSDDSAEWKKLDFTQWDKMGMKFEQEAEFWMSFNDFMNIFTNIDICHFVNTSVLSLSKTWKESMLKSEWSVQGRNGGGDFDSATFLSNPQYVFDITAPKDNVIMSLEQNDIPAGKQGFGQVLNTIGFHLMKVEENRRFRVHIPGKLVFKSSYARSRNIYGSTELKKGRYVIVPTTQTSGEVGEFLLRIYSGGNTNGKELKHESPSNSCCGKPYVSVTTITIEGATGLKTGPKSKKNSVDAYCVIRCEGEKVESAVVSSSSSPKWNVKATFYRKQPDKPIIIEIYDHNTVFDDFLGMATESHAGSEQGNTHDLDLYGKSKKELDVQKPGHVKVHLRSSFDLQLL